MGNAWRLEDCLRPNIIGLKPYSSARSSAQDGVLLDANENPFPLKRFGSLLNRYPDPNQRELREALGRFVGVSGDQVLAGSGSDEVLDWVFKVFLQPGVDRVAIPEPTYGMYRVMANIFGVGIHELRLDEDFQFKTAAFLKDVPADVKLIFLCSPNNPTGNLLDRNEIAKLAGCWGGIVVLDEAYIEFAKAPSMIPQLEDFPNLVVMRTFSKAFARAGLRLGYAVASSAIVDYFQRVKAPYNLNRLILAQGIEALDNLQDAGEAIAAILEERSRVMDALKRLARVAEVFPTETNFVLFRCQGASEVVARLRDQGIVVRDRSGLPGLEDCVRVTIGTEMENSLFLERLECCLEE